jgi:hypothetical protein
VPTDRSRVLLDAACATRPLSLPLTLALTWIDEPMRSADTARATQIRGRCSATCSMCAGFVRRPAPGGRSTGRRPFPALNWTKIARIVAATISAHRRHREDALMGMRSRTAPVAHRRKSLGNASYDNSFAIGSGQEVCGLKTSTRGVIGLVAPLTSWRWRDRGVLRAGASPNCGFTRRTSLVC